MTTTATLYERLGGRDGILKVCGDFYDQVLLDPQLSDIFYQVDMRRQTGMLAAWVGAQAGGPEYRGKDLRSAHQHLHLTASHFGAVAAHLQTALETNGVSDEDVQTVMGVAAAAMPEVLNS